MTVEELLEEYGIDFDSVNFRVRPGYSKKEILEKLRKEHVIFLPEPKRVTCEKQKLPESKTYNIGS